MGLIWYNEGWMVRTGQSLDEAAKLCIDSPSETLLPENIGKVVYVQGAISVPSSVEDSSFGVEVNRVLDMARTVEMYQWVEKEHKSTTKSGNGGTTTRYSYTYSKQWRSSREASENFHTAGYTNPPFPSLGNTVHSLPSPALVGVYRLSDELQSQLGRREDVNLAAPGVLKVKNGEKNTQGVEWSKGEVSVVSGKNSQTVEVNSLGELFDGLFSFLPTTQKDLKAHIEIQPVSVADPSSLVPLAPAAKSMRVHPDGLHLTTSSSSALTEPSIGDVRVSFQARRAPSSGSFVALLMADGTLAPYHAEAGDTVAIAADGVVSRAALFLREHQRKSVRTWLIRFFGWLLLFASFAMLLQPISVAPELIPFCGPLLGSLVGTATCLVSLTMSTAVAVIVIAIAWLFHRPLFAGILLLIAAGLSFVTFQAQRSRSTPRDD